MEKHMTDINLTDATTVLATLTEVIEEIAGPRSVAITRGAAFDADLGLDSLTMVEIIVVAEERFDIKIPDSAFVEMTTVGEAVDFIADSVTAARTTA